MAAVSRSPRLFLQRAGLRSAHRTGPVAALNNLRIRVYPEAVTPPAILARATLGDPPPDRATTGAWPPGSTTYGS